MFDKTREVFIFNSLGNQITVLHYLKQRIRYLRCTQL